MHRPETPRRNYARKVTRHSRETSRGDSNAPATDFHAPPRPWKQRKRNVRFEESRKQSARTREKFRKRQPRFGSGYRSVAIHERITVQIEIRAKLGRSECVMRHGGGERVQADFIRGNLLYVSRRVDGIRLPPPAPRPGQLSRRFSLLVRRNEKLQLNPVSRTSRRQFIFVALSLRSLQPVVFPRCPLFARALKSPRVLPRFDLFLLPLMRTR